MSFFNKIGGKKNAAHTDKNDVDAGDALFDDIAESVTQSSQGSSVSMSVESIVATASSDAQAFPAYDQVPKKKGGGLLSFLKREPKKDDFVAAGDAADYDDGFAYAPAAAVPTTEEQSKPDDDERTKAIFAEIGARPRPLPVLGKMSPKRQYATALTIMAASLAAAGFLSVTALMEQTRLKERVTVGTRTQLATQNIMLTAQNLVVRADPAAYGALGADRNALKEVADLLKLSTSSQSAAITTKIIEEKIYPVIERSLKIGADFATLGRQVSTIQRNTSELYEGAERLASYLASSQGTQLQQMLANDIRVRAERLALSGTRLLGTATTSAESRYAFADDVLALGKALNTLMDPAATSDPYVRTLVGDVSDTLGPIEAASVFMAKYAADITAARADVIGMRDAVGQVSFNAGNYVTQSNAEADALSKQVFLALGIAGIAVAALILLALINSRITRIEAWEAAFKNKSNEKDIIDFMREILPLELGDLTVAFTTNTTAMEGITGGIRSSVNEAVTSLREAMSTVRGTTDSVIDNVNQSVSGSRDLSASNVRQAHEIEEVVARVADLTSAIGQVTGGTIRAAEMTTAAKSASDTGARVVSQTNEKMTEIRANMQDVLKSVKHLGETSHEIGTIVEAIETITDRTQVIAVNASLEAAKAGAAGQGFSVLAGEVNRLAEQSNEALRTITALVQRIQGETAATIRVVEDSTNNVVEGARLSEAANAELSKISGVSEALQKIMTEIRTQSEGQSGNATLVRDSMDRLVSLSRDFQKSVEQMVQGVESIDASMGTLQSTVSIFKTEGQSA